MKTTRYLLSAVIATVWMAATLVFSPLAHAEEGLKSLRGAAIQANDTESADPFKNAKDSAPIERNYVQQPPLIPHKVDGYNVTANFNKCMDCHAWNRYKETGATKVSLTHFKSRDGQDLSNISPRRYFCQQCHVSQVDAKPLVANTFKPADNMR